MARYSYVGYKRPKNTKNTLKHLLHYMGLHKWMFLLVGVLVCISTGASVMGTYLLKQRGGSHGRHVSLRCACDPGLQPAHD